MGFVFVPQELYVKSPGSGKIEPIYLQGVTFADGSVSHDLPMNKISQLFNVDNFIVSQVNPHLVPFLFHSIVAPIPLFERVFRFLANEFHLYSSTILVNLRELGILRGISSLNSLFTQKYTGDVTMVPDIPISDYFRILSNPSLAYIQQCSDLSERATYKHVSRLQGLCATEFTIDQCLILLRSQLVIGDTDGASPSVVGGGLNRISSFMAPHTNSKYNSLHIPQTIYNSILHNTEQEANVDDMDSVDGDEMNERENRLSSLSLPQLNQSNIPNNKSFGSNGLPKSVSFAELCSDLPNVM